MRCSTEAYGAKIMTCRDDTGTEVNFICRSGQRATIHADTLGAQSVMCGTASAGDASAIEIAVQLVREPIAAVGLGFLSALLMVALVHAVRSRRGGAADPSRRL